MVQVSSGQRQLIDLNDSKALQLFLSSSQSNTQIYNQTTGGYSPDWTSAKPVVTPELYAPGTNTNILSQAKSITWFDEGTQISSGTNYTLGSGNQTLTINTNRVIAIDDALSFDSSTTAVTTPTLFASAPSALTVMVKFRMVATPSSYTTIADFGTPATGAGAIYIEGVQGVNQLLFGAAVTSGGNAFSGATNEGRSGGLTINQFHVATMVLTASSMLVYVDGSLATTVAGTYDLSKAVHALTIGAGRAYFNGDIAYVGVFNTAVQPEFVSQYSTNGLKGNEPGLVNYYNLVTASGTTVTDSVGAKNATISGTFTLPSAATLHKKTVMCQVVYTDPAVQTDLNVTATIDITRLYTGTVGNQGAPVAMAYLNNDSSVVATNNDGTGGTYGAPNTQSTMTIMLGGTDVTSLYTFSQTKTNVTVTEPTTSNVATITAMSADTGSVTFTATRSGYPTLTKTFYLAKSKMGVVGQNPTDWWLNVSSGTIATADDGSYTPSTITISAESQVGTGTPAAYAGRFIIAESADGNTFTNKYTSSSDESSHAYSPSSGLKAIKVTLYQAGGTSVKLDEQNIMVIGNGKNSVMVSAWTPTGNVIHNAGNTVTAQASLLNGGLDDSANASNFRWVKQNGSATSVIAGAGYEDLDSPKRNYILGSNVNYTITGSIGASKSLSPSLTFSADAIAAMNRTGQLTVSLDYQVTNLAYGSTNPWVGMEISITYSDSTQGWYDAAGSTHIPAGTSNGWVRTSSTYPLKSGVTVTAATISVLVRDCTGSVSMTNFKAEVGTQATPWCAAYEEATIDPTDNTLYGRNLLKNSELIAPLSNNGSIYPIANTQMSEGNLSFYRTTRTSQSSYPTTFSIYNNIYSSTITQELQGKTVTMSFKARCSQAIPCTVMAYFTDPVAEKDLPPHNSSINLTTSWQTFSWTFPINFLVGASRTLRFTPYAATIPSGQIASFYVDTCDFKIEINNVGTDWTPAPEDNSAKYPTTVAGCNNWVYKNFPVPTANGSHLVTYSDLVALTGGTQTLVADGTNLVQGVGTEYYGYLKTAVYTSTAKTLNITFTHDDSCSIYVNGLAQYQKTIATTGATAALVLQEGWNSIEFMYNQSGGGDGVYGISPTFSSSVDELNANFALDYGSLKGDYGLAGYNTSSMIVNTNAVTDTDLFMCVVTYRGSNYTDSVTIDDVSDPMTVVITGADFFKNSQGTNTYTARLYQNGTEIDTSGTQYTYTWYVYNSDGTQDMTFGGSGSKTGKTITLAASDINVSGDIVCNVS